MKKWSIFLLAFICWPSIWVQAQEQVPGEEAKVLEEVVISATRTEVPAKETSVSSTVITRDQIEARQVSRVEEMLRTVPGATVIQSGSRGGETALFIRGGESDHNQILLNGIKLNDVGGSYDFSVLTVDNVEGIEVIRGPMSSLYGNDALTGVVNLMTRKGRGKPTLGVTSLWGGHSEGHSPNNLISEQRANIEGAYKQFAYSAAYSRIDDTGILPINNRFASHVLNTRFDYDPLENLSFTFTNLVIDSFFGFPTVNAGDRFDPKSVGGPGLDPDQNNTRLDLVLGLQGNYWPFDWWENVLTLSHVRLDRNYNNPANPEATAADAFGSFFSRNLERHYTLEYHSNFRWGDQDRLNSISTVGLELRADQFKGHTHGVSFFTGPFVTSSKFRRGSTSWYAQEQLAFWNRFFFTVGGRIEDNRAFNKLEFAPRASAALRFPETDTTLRAAGGRGIKAPTFLESSAETAFSVGNPNLKPEENISWEVGVDQWLWKDRLQLGLTYFENHFSDFITFVPSTIAFAPGTFENIGEVRSTGLEFSFRASPGWGLTLSAAYTHLFQFTVIDDGGLGNIYFANGQKVLRRPRHAFNFDINGKWDRLETHLNGLYLGRRDDNYYDWATFNSLRVTNGGFFVLNLAASYDVLRDWGHVKKVQVMAHANNLLDRFYEESYGYSSPRFSIVGGLRFVFQ
ncbi:MAG: TonB-dependent receptor plug domain-containing protein [Desulfobacteraceae bacterium]